MGGESKCAKIVNKAKECTGMQLSLVHWPGSLQQFAVTLQEGENILVKRPQFPHLVEPPPKDPLRKRKGQPLCEEHSTYFLMFLLVPTCPLFALNFKLAKAFPVT